MYFVVPDIREIVLDVVPSLHISILGIINDFA